jgi:hypothetical protein
MKYSQYLYKIHAGKKLTFREEQLRQAHVRQLEQMPKDERLALSIAWWLIRWRKYK